MKYKEFSKLIMDSINFIKSLFTLKRNKELLDERFKYLSGTFHKHGEYAYFSLELDEGGRSVSEPINIPKGCKSRIYNSLWYETDPLWHKISDGDLPNKSGMFLVSIKGGHHQVIRYCHKDKLWATVFEQEDLEYWRENPSLPGK